MPSPRISFRIPEEVREELVTICDEHGISLSDFAREALYLALLIEQPEREINAATRRLSVASEAIQRAIKARAKKARSR